jgi:hypothetical protein
MTKEYQAYLLDLADRLFKFNLRTDGDIYENHKRNNLFFPLWISKLANSKHYKDAAGFHQSIQRHAQRKHRANHSIIAEGLINEVNRRKNLPIDTSLIKFPKWLEDKRNLDILCEYLEFLLGEKSKDEEIPVDYAKDALKKAEEHIKAELEYLY